MSAQLQREYDATLDSKNRFTLRGSPFNHYHVKHFKSGRVVLEPRVLARPDQLSKKTLRMLDRSIQNFAKGVVGKAIDLDDLRQYSDTKE